jgi:hypothetical protein
VCHGRASGDDERTRALSKVEAHRRIIEGASIDFSGYFAAIARTFLNTDQFVDVTVSRTGAATGGRKLP